MKFTWTRFFMTLSVVTLIIHGLIRFWPVGPVVSGMYVQEWQYSGGNLTAHIIGYKNRDECAPVENTMSGYHRNDGPWVEDTFMFLDDDPDEQGTTSKPAGDNDFGWWLWEVGEVPSEVMMTMTHICPEGRVTTEVGPFEVELDND